MVKKQRKEEINEGARTRHMRPEMRKQKKKQGHRVRIEERITGKDSGKGI